MRSIFSAVPTYAGDAIFALVEAFQKDPNPNKVSLSIGTYFDEDGRIPAMAAVRAAKLQLLPAAATHPYLPIPGLESFRQATKGLIFGNDALLLGRTATVQSIGGTGALKLGADFLRRTCADAAVWVSDPTWENHEQVFGQAGFTVHKYPYYDAATGEVRFAEMAKTLRSLPKGSIVVLHASCHNPTGVDLSHSQWGEIVALCANHDLIPFFDLAYQGFGEGLDDDALPIRMMARAGVEFLVASSFSKNFSLYGERCGALSVVCRGEEDAQRVLGQVKSLIRGNYSTPPTFGAALIGHILSTPELRASWETELKSMRVRLVGLRSLLCSSLTALTHGEMDFRYIEAQRGMFSYMQLSPQQVERLRKEHAVYLLKSGRLCVAGLTVNNVDYVARAIAMVLSDKRD
ncbi:Aromatic-amino-acid aminotransferase [compost metagenome]|jgi:aromatic-amino-acid transaminase